jgi:hypothetical protein
VKDNGEEPNRWTQVPFANLGTSGEFVELLTEELLELVDGSANCVQFRRRCLAAALLQKSVSDENDLLKMAVIRGSRKSRTPVF